MATMNISLPDDMKAWVDQQTKAHGYATTSEYVRAMIRERREAIERLRAALLEGIASGNPQPADDAYFEHLRATIGRRTAAE